MKVPNFMKDSPDKNTITEFVDHLRKNGYPNLKIDRWPDKENSATPDIDAIAGPFAIEHTSVDTLLNQRKYGDWFKRVTANLESELFGRLPFSLQVRFEYEAFIINQNWATIHNALKRWILEDAPQLEWGCRELDDVPGIPFTVYVEKTNQPPFRLLFSRCSPIEAKPRGLSDKWDPLLPPCFRGQLDKKAKKLARYKACGKTTTLLIESDDIAFMNPRIMLGWIKKAYPGGLPDGVDWVWYAARFGSEFRFEDFTSDIRRDT